MSELSRQSGVPAPTIKHYFREGLLPKTQERTSRNMAYYDLSLVPRIRAIKEIQRTRFLPLCVIREVLERTDAGTPLQVTLRAVERTLDKKAPSSERTRRELIAAGMPSDQLDYFNAIGVVTPARGEGDDAVYAGDDLGLLQTLGAARRAGITPEMLPHTILAAYAHALNELVKAEIDLFRQGILPHAGDRIESLVESAASLSEDLILRLRRKLLLPALRRLAREDRSQGVGATPRKATTSRGSIPGRTQPSSKQGRRTARKEAPR